MGRLFEMTEFFELGIGCEDGSDADMSLASGFVRRGHLSQGLDRGGFELLRCEIFEVDLVGGRGRRGRQLGNGDEVR